MGDSRAASHQSVPTLTTAPLNANATLLLVLVEAASRPNHREQKHDRGRRRVSPCPEHWQVSATSAEYTLPPLSRTSHFDAGRPLLDGCSGCKGQ